ncbi:MAG: hypothetical protein AAF749_05475 [Pseudomonadota bacterium]
MNSWRAITAVLLSGIVCSVFLTPAHSHAQFNTSRAIQRALETNTRRALERVQLSLKVKESAGKVVVQKTSRNGRYLLLVFEDNRARIWDLQNSRYWDHFLALEEPVVMAAIGGDMSFFTIHRGGKIARWSAASRAPVSVTTSNLSGATAAEVGRTGELLLTASDGAIYSFSESLERLAQAFAQPGRSRTVMAMGPSGDVFVTSVADSKLRLWSSRTGAPLADIELGDTVSAFTFSDVSSQLLIATNKAIIDWDVRSAKRVGEFPCRAECQVEKLLVNTATQSLIAVQEDGELLRWSLVSRQTMTAIAQPNEGFASLSTSAGSPLLIGGTSRGFVQFSHLDRPQLPLTLVSTSLGWAMLDELGRFDGQAGENNGIFWGNQGVEFPLPSFVDTHFEPGLFHKWLGEDGDYFTSPKALSEGVLAPPRIELSLTAPDPGDPKQLIEATVTVTDNGGGVGEPSLYHLGLRVGRDKQVSRNTTSDGEQETVTTTWRVRALPGENTFTAKVKDTEGVVSPARVDSVQVTGAKADPVLHLLAIAIDDYGDGALNLNYSLVDAEAVVTNLAQSASPLFSSVRGTTIENKAATRKGVLAALRDLRSAKPEDVIVVYAATHGDVVNEEFHLLLQGLRVPFSQRSLKRVGLPFSEIARELESLDARRVIMLLDTCKSGDALANLQSEFRDRRALQSFSNLLGIHLIAATAKGQLATESSVLGHGVFTYSLLEGLQGKADASPSDGLLTASELADFAEAGVPALSAKYAAFPQWPTVYARGFDFSVASPSLADGKLP